MPTSFQRWNPFWQAPLRAWRWLGPTPAVRLLPVLTALLLVLPVLAMARGVVELLEAGGPSSPGGWIGTVLSFLALVLGTLLFAYSIRYYLATIIVLATTGSGRRNGEGNGYGNGKANGNGNGLSRIAHRARGGNGGIGEDENDETGLDHEPFVSIHIASYNEKRVLERLLESCARLDYDNYEVVLVDDSNDETLDILDRWQDRPRFKIAHRSSRDGFKGGALDQALRLTDPRAEFILVFDADAVPFPDSPQRFLPHFYRRSPRTGSLARREEVAAVQSYQWHVLNKSENWLTAAVRAEYSGSYMVERVYQDDIGAMKMVAGTAYMIRADLLRELGWGRSLTEDWELTLRLYRRGYRVVYTPYAETPAECVSTFARLARQRMRWAEGHMFNVRRHFWPVLLSPFVSAMEKLEFLYFAGYYLQGALLAAGMFAWLVAEIGLGAHVPEWTATFGWSLLLTNMLALPIMNLAGLALEEASRRDLAGVLGALAISYLLVPFQAYAAIKGLLEAGEGPWFRTPKTGRITDPIRHLRRLRAIRRWLFRGPNGNGNGGGNGDAGGPAHTRRRPPARRAGWVVIGGMFLALACLGVQVTHVPVAEAAGTTLYMHAGNVMNTTAPAAISPQMKTFAATGDSITWATTTATAASQTIAMTDAFVFTYFAGPGSIAMLARLDLSYSASPTCINSTTIVATNVTLGVLVGQQQTPAFSPPLNTVVPGGSFFCWTVAALVSVSYTLLYDSASTPTNLNSSDVILIPERLLALLALGLLAPTVMRRLARAC